MLVRILSAGYAYLLRRASPSAGNGAWREEAILPYRDFDTAELLGILIGAVPDAATRRAILSENAQRLYVFDPWVGAPTTLPARA